MSLFNLKNELKQKEQDELMELFLKHFCINKSTDDVLVAHPKVTNPGCVHIDVGLIKNDTFSYAFSFGCSIKTTIDKRYCELYYINENDVESSTYIHYISGFNNKDYQLRFLRNNEYVFIDVKNKLNDLNNKFGGFFLYNSFDVTTKSNKIITYIELVPATKEELIYVENYKGSYNSLIKAFKEHLGDRRNILDLVGLTKEEMDKISKSIR